LQRSTADVHNAAVIEPVAQLDHEHGHDVDPELEAAWRAVLNGDLGQLKYIRAVLGRIPGAPRCKLCLAPLKGPASILLKPFRFGPSKLNRRLCRACFRSIENRPGGAEIELSLMFADVRGSTSLAEKMQPQEFSRLISRFYGTAARVVDEWDGLVDKFVGDEAVALFVPGFAGEDHAARAVGAARSLIHETGNDHPDPWVPLGIGVHTGVAYVGRVGEGDACDFTAVGDAVNTTARLASSAGAGEILVSKAAADASVLDAAGLEARSLALRGKDAMIDALVLAAESRGREAA
jgi:adenylate cyclase